MLRNSHGPTCTRRGFAKASGAALALAAASGSLLACSSQQLEKKDGKPAEEVHTEERYGACRMCHQQKCNYKCTIENDVAIRLEGVRNSYVSNGTLCARGNSLIPQHYNPYRVKTPLKRTNPERGFDVDPGWQEISWDEAIETVATHLKECTDTDPRTFLFNQGFARTGVVTRMEMFQSITKSPNAFESNGPLCAKHFPGSSSFGSFNSMIFDFTLTEYVLNMDRNLGPSTGNNDTKFMSYSMKRGMKIVNCDPRFSPECDYKNGEWVPIKPGGELPFIMSLCEILVMEEGFYDKAFLQWRTNMPYLIASSGDYARDEASNKPLIWDEASGSAKVFDDESLEEPALEGTYSVNGEDTPTAFELFKDTIRDMTPAVASKYADVAESKIREIASELMAHSGIVKEDQSQNKTIVVEGKELPLRPVAIVTGRGTTSQKNGIPAMVEANNLNLLLGCASVPGGLNAIQFRDNYKTVDKDGLVALTSEAVPWWATKGKFTWPPNRIDLKELYPFSHNMPHIAYKVCQDPAKYGIDYKPKMLWTYGGNPLVANASGEVTAKGIKNIDFQCTTSYHMDEPAWFADIVMPEDSNLERWATLGFKNVGFDPDDNPVCYEQQQIQHPVVDRLYDTRMADDIFADVFEAAGFLQQFIETHNEKFGDEFKLPPDKKPSAKDLFDCQIKTAWGADHGIDEDTPEGFISKEASWDQRYNYAVYPELKHGHYRHRMYFEHLLLTGKQLKENLAQAGLDTVPGWTEGGHYFEYFTAFPQFFEDDYVYNVPGRDMRLINWKTAQFTGLVGGNDNPYLVQVSKDLDPFTYGICMNPAKAKELGVSDGDIIEVESQHGKLEGPVILTESFRPDCVGIGGNLGRKSIGLNPIANEGQCYNELLAPDEDWIDPIGGQIPMTPWVSVKKKA